MDQAKPDGKLAPRVIGPKLLTEVIGTLFLTWAVGMTGGTQPTVAPLAIGGTLMAMVYAGGHISGAHYNPTVSLAVFCRGLSTPAELVLYIVAQLVGGFIGAGFAVSYQGGTDKLGCPTFGGDSYSVRQACLAEFLWSLLLATVVLNVATAKATTNNSYYGLCIGFTVVSGATAVGGVSGGAFNAAVGLALNAVKGGDDAYKLWVYLIFPALGGCAGGFLFRLTSPADFINSSFRIIKDEKKADAVAAYVMEFFATFYLALFVALGPLRAGLDPLLTAFSLFALCTTLLFTAGAASGCHMNPAVSCGLFVRFGLLGTNEKTRAVFPPMKALIYVLCQLAAGLAAGGIGLCLLVKDELKNTQMGFPTPSLDGQKDSGAFFGEVQGVFALVYVVLNTATVRSLEGNSFFGIAIGMTIAATAFALSDVSGGCLNPAVAMLAPIASTLEVNKGVNFEAVWVYWIACPLGGVLAAIIFRFTNLDEFDEAEQAKEGKPPRRYSVMTSGFEDEARQNKMMLMNDMGEKMRGFAKTITGTVYASSTQASAA